MRFRKPKGKMKTTSKHLNGMAVVSTLMLAVAITGQAGPAPDLMNSLWRIRLDAEKSTKAQGSEMKTSHGAIVSWSWLQTRNITAGQSTVAVPDTSHAMALGRSQDSQPKRK